AIFNRHFARKAPGVLERLPADWDLVFWGWNFDSILHVKLFDGLKDDVMRFDSTLLGQRIAEFRETAYDVVPLRLRGAFGLVCYSISPKGATHLKELCFPLKNETIHVPGLRRTLVNFPLDTAMNKHYAALNAYVCFPPLVYTENDEADSDVVRTSK